MDIKINIDSNNLQSPNNCDIKMNNIKFQKMVFLFNAINDGWTIKKRNDSYIFNKKHEGKKEIFREDYLLSFMKDNFDINSLLS
jgi:hypothetical protein